MQGRARRDAGRVDARRVDEARHALDRPDDPVTCGVLGAHAGERVDHLVKVRVGVGVKDRVRARVRVRVRVSGMWITSPASKPGTRLRHLLRM